MLAMGLDKLLLRFMLLSVAILLKISLFLENAVLHKYTVSMWHH